MMELYAQILKAVLENEEIQVSFPNLTINAEELIDRACYQALRQIRAVLDDDRLDDPECFLRIEEIVRIFEKMGSDGGCRHDF